MAGQVTIEVDGDDVVVLGRDVVNDRVARLFFLGSLGAIAIDGGWRCPRRRRPLSQLVVRINTFLESKGWKVSRDGLVNDEVERALERKRSFQRTREAAEALLSGRAIIDIDAVEGTLETQGWRNERRLLPHQKQGVVHALTATNAANFSVPGAGKTATTIAVAATHVASGTVEVVLVIGPLSCFAPWEHETAVALGSQLRTRRVRGSAAERRAAYKAVRPRDIVLVSYATAASDRISLIDLCQNYRTMLVVDESHRVKRFQGGTWAPALVAIAKEARVRIILSGTPMPQSGKDLYTQLNILWPDGELTGPRDGFAVRVDRDFGSLLQDIRPFMSRTPKHALGLAPYTITRHDVPLAGTQAEIYELIESYFRKRVVGIEMWAEKIEALRRGRPIRLLQAASNPEVLNRKDANYRLPRLENSSASLMERLVRYREHETPAKTVYALRLLDRFAAEGRKVVCWSNFIANLDHFARGVRERAIECFQVDGRIAAGSEPTIGSSTSDEEPETRERVIERFLDTKGAAVLVANPASCSESISLHRSCWIAIYLDRTYDCALFLQSIDRIHRLGLPLGVQVEVHILNATLDGRGTIDQLVDSSLLQKEETMLQLLQGAELATFSTSEDPLDAAEGNEDDLAALLRFLLGEAS
ncbi:DEAD/DEAH box helicase [Paraliomyxa miuraensis]|uniref:DEAD/DEAH box helicase n=1 Tax=Paraliomyxa miuraensis TaxID=376150 RepID=UPI00225A035B|nr:DEAD/DEAH box helicase [Paraliomyxa miuraensis]MCX4239639.1 DEAD/DEAH box helicase [Paraliomyxa miuraensis]